MTDNANDVATILGEALEQSSLTKREQFLDSACGDNSVLRRQVDQLLRNHERAGQFLEQPALLPTRITGPELPDTSVGSTIGPYKLREQLGEGGMGVVFVAEQERPVRRKVAVKIIKPGMASRDVIARFEAERQALAMMDHPNIAKVLDAGTGVSGSPYFVMELVRGLPITEYCDKSKLSTRERLKLFAQVCQAVQHAHQKGIIHRDLKPGNVLVTLHDGVPVPKVIDFGVAKAINQRLTEQTIYTRHAQMVGTPLYMSPEQAELSGLDIDTRSDVYSLGVLLYELLVGVTPFDKSSFASAGYDEMRRIIREDEPPRPSQRISTLDANLVSTISDKRGLDERKLAQSLKGELDWIVMKALEKDRQRRYESASAFAVDIQRYLDNEPVSACPPSVMYRLRKFVVRNRAKLFTTVCVIAAISCLLMVPVSWSLARQGRDAVAQRTADTALISAQAALQANDLPLAERKLAEARAVLESADHVLSEPDEQLKALQADLGKRKENDELFTHFLKDARIAGTKMGHSNDAGMGGERLARETLQLLNILDSDDWTRDLEHLAWSDAGKDQIREVVYETLLALADSLDRWDGSDERTAEGMKILTLAEKHHAPTKGLYWCRWRFYDRLKNRPEADAAKKQYDSTPATVPLDYYIPGHTLGWWGNRDAAIKAYQAALRLQPDHYNSLFFLADRLKHAKRYPEAVAYFTCCIALEREGTAVRHKRITGLEARAQAYELAGDLVSAELDLIDATRATGDPHQIISAHQELANLYERQGQLKKSRDVLMKMLEMEESFIVQAKKQQNRDDKNVLRLLGYLSATNQQLENYAKTIEIQEESLKLARQILPPADVLEQVNKLSVGYMDAERHQEAIKLLQDELKIGQNPLEIRNQQDAFAVVNLAQAYHYSGRTEEAIPLILKALEFCNAKLGIESDTTADLLLNLGAYYVAVKRNDEARAILEESLAIRRKNEGDRVKKLLPPLRLLGTCNLQLKDYPKALEYTLEALSYTTQLYGAEHKLTCDALDFTAYIYEQSSQFSKAISLLEESLESRMREKGLNHHKTLLTMERLGGAMIDAARLTEARDILEQALPARIKMSGPEDVESIKMTNNLGLVYLDLGEYANARDFLEQALEAHLRVDGPDHPETQVSIHNLANVYLELNNFPRSIEMFHSLISTKKRMYGPDDSRLLNPLAGLADAYQRSEQFNQAIEVANEWIEIARKAQDPVELAAALARTAHVLLAMDKWAEAEPIARESAQIREAIVPDAWQRFGSLLVLSESLVGQEKWIEAEPLLRQGLEGLKQRAPTISLPGKKVIEASVTRLIKRYTAQNRLDDAAYCQQQLKALLHQD